MDDSDACYQLRSRAEPESGRGLHLADPEQVRKEEGVCDPAGSRKHTGSEPLVQDRLVRAVRLHRGKLGIDDREEHEGIAVRYRERVELIRQNLATDGRGGWVRTLDALSRQ